jgi:hypothetical protein
MARFQEDLSGGWVTSKDPALLAPGQLSNVRNATYHARTGSALSRAFGRTIFGSASAASAEVDGLRDIQFDTGDHYLVAMVTGANAKYRIASISATGTTNTFADLVTITAGSALEVVHYNNRFFLLNGVTAAATATSSNRVVYMTASAVGSTVSARQHGLLAVSAAPAVSASGGVFSQTVTGYYEYWTTEVAKLFQDGSQITLESTFDASANPTTVFVSSTAFVPVIQMPNPLNEITTHWRIYRSPKKDKESDKKFPTGFMIGEMATAASATASVFFADSITTTATASFASASASSLGLGGFTNASAMFVDDTTFASGVNTLFGVKAQGIFGYNLGGFSGNVKGIVVELQGYISAGASPVPITVTVGPKDPSADKFLVLSPPFGFAKTASKGGTLVSTNSGAPDTLTFGTSTDRWRSGGEASQFVDSEFSGNFMVSVSFSKAGTSIGIDYLKLTVHYSASTDSTVPFPTVVYTFGDIIAQVGKNGPPPGAGTGDMFEDCLVTNSANEPALIRWSYPGLPESFPATFFIDFETRDNDVVRLVKTVNNRLIVGLDNSLWRVNYLPSERDASFDRGKAIEAMSRQYGVVNPMCACTFTIDGETEHLAFISHRGIHSTDGANFYDRGGNLDWRDVIPLGSNTRCIALINDAENYRLLFFYQNDAEAPESFKRIDFFYDSIDVGGQFKVGGRVHMRNFNAAGGGFAALKSAWSSPTTEGGTTLWYGYGGASAAAGAGQVFYESGNVMPAQDPSFGYSTRRMYLAGYGNEFRANQLYGFTTTATSATVAPTASYQFTNLKTNAFVSANLGTKTTQVGGQGIGLHRVPVSVAAEGLMVNMSVTTGVNEAFSEEFLILDGDGFGGEDSGK